MRLQDTAPGPVYDTGASAGRAAARPGGPAEASVASEIETDVQRAGRLITNLIEARKMRSSHSQPTGVMTFFTCFSSLTEI